MFPPHTVLIFLSLNSFAAIMQLIVDVLMDAQRSVVEGSFPTGASILSAASQIHASLLPRQQLTWNERT